MAGCSMLKRGNGEKSTILSRISQGSIKCLDFGGGGLILNNAYFYVRPTFRPFSRLWHTACPGKDSDVIVFGGSCDYILLVDTVSIKKTKVYL